MSYSQFSYDPHTGVQTLVDEDMSGTLHFLRREDLSGVIELAKQNRAARRDDAMMKTDEFFCLFASIPPTIEHELLKKGLRLGRDDDMPAIIKEIEANYPYLKHTERKLWRPA